MKRKAIKIPYLPKSPAICVTRDTQQRLVRTGAGILATGKSIAKDATKENKEIDLLGIAVRSTTWP